MRRWMSIITLSALVLALVAGWGIGQLAGGGSGETDLAVRAIPSLEASPTGAPLPTVTATSVATPPGTATPEAAVPSPAESTSSSPIQRPTSVPEAP